MPYARHAVRDCHTRQSATAIERFIPYARYAVRNGHARQAPAVIERMIGNISRPAKLVIIAATDRPCARQATAVIERNNSYACYATGYRHVCQPTAESERTISYAGHTPGYRHAHQAAAAPERINPYARHAVGDGYARQTVATTERMIGNISRPAKLVIIAATDRTCARQTTAVIERIISYARHAPGYRHICQSTAVSERFIPYARYTVRNCHARQPSTAIERSFPYARHPYPINKLRDIRPGNTIATLRNLPRLRVKINISPLDGIRHAPAPRPRRCRPRHRDLQRVEVRRVHVLPGFRFPGILRFQDPLRPFQGPRFRGLRPFRDFLPDLRPLRRLRPISRDPQPRRQEQAQQRRQNPFFQHLSSLRYLPLLPVLSSDNSIKIIILLLALIQ